MLCPGLAVNSYVTKILNLPGGAWGAQPQVMSRSLLWNFFTKETDNHDYAICNLCAVKICRKGGSTTAMGNHLRIKHKSVILSSASGQSAMNFIADWPEAELVWRQRCNPLCLNPLWRALGLAWMCAVDVRPISIVESLY